MPSRYQSTSTDFWSFAPMQKTHFNQYFTAITSDFVAILREEK